MGEERQLKGKEKKEKKKKKGIVVKWVQSRSVDHLAKPLVGGKNEKGYYSSAWIDARVPSSTKNWLKFLHMTGWLAG